MTGHTLLMIIEAQSNTWPLNHRLAAIFNFFTVFVLVLSLDLILAFADDLIHYKGIKRQL